MLIKRLLPLTAIIPFLHLSPACADQIISSEQTTVTTGVGVRGANKFNFKYQERLKTYEHQIQLGLEKGWLSKEDAATFSTRLEALKIVEEDARKKGYQRADVDALELQVTAFNKDFTDAGQKSSKSKPVSTPKPVAESTTKTETKTTPAKAPVSSKTSTAKTATNKKTAVKKTTK